MPAEERAVRRAQVERGGGAHELVEERRSEVETADRAAAILVQDRAIGVELTGAPPRRGPCKRLEALFHLPEQIGPGLQAGGAIGAPESLELPKLQSPLLRACALRDDRLDGLDQEFERVKQIRRNRGREIDHAAPRESLERASDRGRRPVEQRGEVEHAP